MIEIYDSRCRPLRLRFTRPYSYPIFMAFSPKHEPNQKSSACQGTIAFRHISRYYIITF